MSDEMQWTWDQWEEIDLRVACWICDTKVMEGFLAGGSDNREYFYCSMDCVEADPHLTVGQACSAYSTVQDLGDD